MIQRTGVAEGRVPRVSARVPGSGWCRHPACAAMTAATRGTMKGPRMSLPPFAPSRPRDWQPQRSSEKTNLQVGFAQPGEAPKATESATVQSNDATPCRGQCSCGHARANTPAPDKRD